MAEGDRYVVVIVDGTVVLKKSEGKCCNCSWFLN
jgi:hypothetical protein